ncbi:MAG: response regulator [Deltaproteobacteria bacterium]|nr:response regulator [Deltaproteobacteria bacterium]
MDPQEMIRGKRLLIVDDEQDVLDSLAALLEMCKIDAALSFEQGKKFLEDNYYDVAILDIMGVKGFELLEIAKKQGVPALMLTAHGLSEENLRKSAAEGASYYAPKEHIADIATFVADVLEAADKNKSPWIKWFERLSGYYDKRFGGKRWREKEKEFWEERIKAID